MLQHEIFHGDTRGLLNAYQFGAKSNAAVVAAVLSSSGIKGSAATWQQQQQQQLVQSPLNSEGSTSATPPECSTSSASKENCTALTPQAHQSSVWSDYLNANGGGGSFMGDNNVIPTSSGTWWSTRDQELQVQQWNINYTLPQSQGGQAAQASQASHASPMSEMEAGEWSPSQLGCLTTAPEVNEQLSKMAIESNDYSSINTALVESEISNNPGSWSSILMGTAGNEDSTLENTSVEGLHEALFSKSFRTDSLSESNIKKAHGSPSWEYPLKGTGFEVDDMNTMNSKLGSHELQFSLGSHDERLSARMELDNWSHMMNESQHRAAGSSSYSLDAFGNAAMDLQRQFDPSKIKQEIDVFYSNSNTSPIIGSSNISMQQGLGGDNFKSSSMTDLLGASKPLMDSGMTNLNIPQMLPSNEVSSRWGSRLPAMLAQVLPSNSSKQANLFGTNMVMSRPFMNYTPKQEHFKVQRMSTEQSSMSQQSSITSQHSDSHASKHMLQMDEGREVSSSPKRSLSSLPNTDHASEPFFKRPRIEQQSPTLPFKATTFVLQVRKEKLGERITALQQLVAPFGKTDTASVLLEAIGYIKFLHEQVQVLSTPYMKNTPTATARQNEPGKGSSSWSSSSSDTKSNKDGDEPRQDLRSRGLCLVPISCTLQVANDNGADFWTPTIGGSSAK